MPDGQPNAAGAGEPSAPEPKGWHCNHFFYRFRRDVLAGMDTQDRQIGCRAFVDLLSGDGEGRPVRWQTSLVTGHQADFAVVMLDPDPLKLDAVHQRLLSSPLGPAIEAVYSFVSMTEVSEYVPTVEQYAARLVAEGEAVGSPSHQAKVRAYEKREPIMRQHRLMPDLPSWPATCFYPMSKRRQAGANWFLLPFGYRNRLMAQHARSGMAFAGRVTQLVTVALGLDDWEWGVTLWAREAEYLKDIVYQMRFDLASAQYAEFGPFYVSYLAPPRQILEHCRIGM
jgi:hydrogen peroxide-dependent heme synthase